MTHLKDISGLYACDFTESLGAVCVQQVQKDTDETLCADYNQCKSSGVVKDLRKGQQEYHSSDRKCNCDFFFIFLFQNNIYVNAHDILYPL